MCYYGELKITKLRKEAEFNLGEKFDLKQFHEVILRSGALSLHMLEEVVKEWIASLNQSL